MKSSHRLESDPGDELTIGQLAERFGLATHVLRHWEDVGLLEPEERVNGRRRYRDRHVARVATILHGKQAGLSLPQLREIFATSDPRERNRILRAHLEEIDRRMEALQESRAMIEHALECPADDFTRCGGFQALARAA